MRPKVNMIGLRFGRLVVTGDSAKSNRHVACLCDCGAVVQARRDGLLGGDNVSCGCKKVEQLTEHGETGTPEHKTWCSMIERCHTPTHQFYGNYGGRGITVCDRWRADYMNFLRDMGRRPSRKHSIDRKDNNAGYSPDNCRWATKKQQGHNRRNNKLTYEKVASIRSLRGLKQVEIADMFGVHPSMISRILSREYW